MNLLFNFFEDSNEKNNGYGTEGRGSMVKCGEHLYISFIYFFFCWFSSKVFLML